MNNYIPQLAELQAHGRAATDEEVTAATETFTKLLGQAQAAKPTTRTRGYETQMTAFLVVAIVALCGTGALAACNLLLGKKKKEASAKEDSHA